MFLEDLQLRLGRREVPVEVEAALSDGHALGVHGELAQGLQRGAVALVLPRLGVVGVDPFKGREKNYSVAMVDVTSCVTAFRENYRENT